MRRYSRPGSHVRFWNFVVPGAASVVWRSIRSARGSLATRVFIAAPLRSGELIRDSLCKIRQRTDGCNGTVQSFWGSAAGQAGSLRKTAVTWSMLVREPRRAWLALETASNRALIGVRRFGWRTSARGGAV